MEKQLIAIMILLFLCTFPVQSQDSLLIFKASGGILLLDNTNQKASAVKGNFISSDQAVVLEQNADLICIDQAGRVYKINIPGRFGVKELHQFGPKEPKSNITTSYFKYLWQEFIQESNNEVIIGGVIRGDTPMVFPPDSARIASAKITFRWSKTGGQNSNFFLWDASGSLLLKTELPGTSINLFRKSELLNGEEQIYWAVTTNPYPNLKNVPRFSLQLIDRKTYTEERNKFRSLILDLKSLGFTDMEIKEVLCEDYKLCE